MSLTPDIVARWLQLGDQIATLQAERDQLQAEIRREIPEGSKASVGDLTVAVSEPSQRLNTAALTKAFPPASHPHLYKLTLDTKKVREHVAPADLTGGGFVTESMGRVSVK